MANPVPLKDDIQTIVVDNFTGSMVPNVTGEMNSGKSYWLNINGNDPFSKPRNLTWNESPVQIDPTGSVITDLILAGKTRIESGVTYVYSIGHTGRLYKIQVNDPTTYNPDYDNPVLLTTLTQGSPTFTRGAFIDFYDSVGRIYISHDMGVTRIDFDGTNETVVGVVGSWSQLVPKPLQQFLGKLYVGNGSNFAEIAVTATVLSYTKLSPGFPSGTQVRDLKLSPDGNYLQVVMTRAALPDITANAVDTTVVIPTDSYIFAWNGTDASYTSSQSYPAIVLTSANFFADSSFVFGYDTYSSAVFTPLRKVITSLPNVICSSPLPNAVFSIGNLVYWIGNIAFNGTFIGLIQTYGSISDQNENGFWCPFTPQPTAPQTDVIQLPFMLPVSNLVGSSSSSGYTDQVVASPKVYYSTLETSGTPTTKYRLYKWNTLPTGAGDAYPGLYETSSQLFSKKASIKQIRIYGNSWVANNEFTVELFDTSNNVYSGSTQIFTAGTNLTIGEDFAWYDPAMKPVYSIGLRITNSGTANFVINKVEIDYTSGGK